MDTQFAKTYLHLIQALAIGKTIQVKDEFTGKTRWHDVEVPSFNMPVEWYRIKPEPKVRYCIVYADASTHDFHSLESANKALGSYKNWSSIIKISVCQDTYETTVEVVKKNAPR